MSDERNAIITTKTAADQTIGAAGLTFITAFGSAALSTLTLLDGAAIKWVGQVTTTQSFSLVISPPIAFTNLVADMTGTAGYSLGYIPRP